jgi:hypothetical protein
VGRRKGLNLVFTVHWRFRRLSFPSYEPGSPSAGGIVNSVGPATSGTRGQTTKSAIISQMCGRYRLSRRKQILEEHFNAVSGEEEWNPRYNIAPTQPIPVIRQHPKGPVRELSLMKWGLIPSWAQDPSGAARMINARSESASTKPAFRDALKSRRCMIPADAFYEWLRHEAACVIVRRALQDRTCHPIGSTLRGMALWKRIV